jgi:hypothetical protein
MPEDYYDDESAPAMAEDASVARETPKEDSTPENKLALVQTSFFKGPVRPGDQEMVEVVEVFENEVSIKCVYGEDEEEAEEPGLGMTDESSPAQAEDAMMT